MGDDELADDDDGDGSVHAFVFAGGLATERCEETSTKECAGEPIRGVSGDNDLDSIYAFL